MPILSGQILTSGRLNALRPTKYFAAATGVLPAGSANVLVPGCTLTFDTQYPNADYEVKWFVDVDLTGASTALGFARPYINGTPTPNFAVFGAEVATDRGTPGNQHQGTLALAGSHTIYLAGTAGANQSINLYTTLSVEVLENPA